MPKPEPQPFFIQPAHEFLREVNKVFIDREKVTTWLENRESPTAEPDQKEAEILEIAARERLSCPRCEAQPLRGEEISTEVYHGVRLTCPDIHCGFVEY